MAAVRSANRAAKSIPLPRLGRVDAQFEKPDRFLLLSVSPHDSGNAEHQSQERQNLPLQHARLLADHVNELPWRPAYRALLYQGRARISFLSDAGFGLAATLSCTRSGRFSAHSNGTAIAS